MRSFSTCFHSNRTRRNMLVACRDTNANEKWMRAFALCVWRQNMKNIIRKDQITFYTVVIIIYCGCFLSVEIQLYTLKTTSLTHTHTCVYTCTLHRARATRSISDKVNLVIILLLLLLLQRWFEFSIAVAYLLACLLACFTFTPMLDQAHSPERKREAILPRMAKFNELWMIGELLFR